MAQADQLNLNLLPPLVESGHTQDFVESGQVISAVFSHAGNSLAVFVSNAVTPIHFGHAIDIRGLQNLVKSHPKRPPGGDVVAIMWKLAIDYVNFIKECWIHTSQPIPRPEPLQYSSDHYRTLYSCFSLFVVLFLVYGNFGCQSSHRRRGETSRANAVVFGDSRFNLRFDVLVLLSNDDPFVLASSCSVCYDSLPAFSCIQLSSKPKFPPPNVVEALSPIHRFVQHPAFPVFQPKVTNLLISFQTCQAGFTANASQGSLRSSCDPTSSKPRATFIDACSTAWRLWSLKDYRWCNWWTGGIRQIWLGVVRNAASMLK
ncbi:hypothetical protein C8J56DRAFT_1026098, partial [Mycena floridula]